MVTRYWWTRKDLISLMLLLLVTSFINTSSGIEFSDLSEPNGVRLELIHRHSLGMRNLIEGKHGQFRMLNQLERLEDLLKQDGIRHQEISRRLATKFGSKAKPVSNSVPFKMPLRAAADYGAGQYFVSVKVGTPAQQFLLIADTGSDLTWTNCIERCGKARHRRTKTHRRVFCADRSSTFTTYPCYSTACQIDFADLASLNNCPTPDTPCAYDYGYADGTTALGIFGNETITVQLANGRKAKLDNMLVGCTLTSQGPTIGLADGLLGLGYSDHSFAVKATEKLGGKFSYCLVDHLSHKNVSNYLVLGPRKQDNNMQYTKLILGVLDPLYAVNVTGISLGGVMVKIPHEGLDVYSGIGGTVVDSGTSLTLLNPLTYEAVAAGLKRSLSKFKKEKLSGPLDYCFDSKGFDESLVPKLVFYFADGAQFGPPVKSYVIDAAPGVKCLGIVSGGNFNVIGNIMQQNHLWEFDIVNGRLGFSPSTCT